MGSRIGGALYPIMRWLVSKQASSPGVMAWVTTTARSPTCPLTWTGIRLGR